MNVYIPLLPILWVLVAYVMVGLLLFVPFVYWQHRFVSNRKSFKVWSGVHVFKGLFFCAVAWPIMLGYNIKTEVHYRKKGYL